jgi:hypothetical protein
MANLTMGDKFFGTTVFRGRLHIRGLAAWARWDPSRFVYVDESALDLWLMRHTDERKVKNLADLESEVAKSLDLKEGSGTLWIHESLEMEAQKIWFNLITV